MDSWRQRWAERGCQWVPGGFSSTSIGATPFAWDSGSVGGHVSVIMSVIMSVED